MKRGRPSLPAKVRRVPINCTVAPETKQRLKREARTKGKNLGRVLDDMAQTINAVK